MRVSVSILDYVHDGNRLRTLRKKMSFSRVVVLVFSLYVVYWYGSVGLFNKQSHTPEFTLFEISIPSIQAG